MAMRASVAAKTQKWDWKLGVTRVTAAWECVTCCVPVADGWVLLLVRVDMDMEGGHALAAVRGTGAVAGRAQ